MNESKAHYQAGRLLRAVLGAAAGTMSQEQAATIARGVLSDPETEELKKQAERAACGAMTPNEAAALAKTYRPEQPMPEEQYRKGCAPGPTPSQLMDAMLAAAQC